MFVSRMLAGLLIMLAADVVCGQESKPATPADVAKEANPAAKEGSASETRPPAVPAEPAAETEKTPAATPEQLQQRVKDLVHQKFATRQAASQKLVQAGVSGMGAAAEAAKTDDLELATRCLAVLTEGLNAKAEEVRKAAKHALEELAKSENKSVAQRARLALDTPRGIAGIQGAPGPANGRNFQQMRVQIVNGVRQITVVDNAKTIVFSDNNGKDISVTITETVNGKQQTQTFKGKDEDDLKKNHPEAHGLFAKYAQGNGLGNNNGGVRIQIGGNAFGGNIFMPVQQARRRVLNPFKAAELLDEVDKLRERLEQSNARLSKAAGAEKPDPAELKKISDEIKTATKRLAEIGAEAQLP